MVLVQLELLHLEQCLGEPWLLTQEESQRISSL